MTQLMDVRRWLLLRMKKILLLLTMMLDTKQTKRSIFPVGSAVQDEHYAVRICTMFLRVSNLNFQLEHISVLRPKCTI
jgi:hypothetical protein